MQINNVSMIGFKANPVSKAVDIATNVSKAATRRSDVYGDVITSAGCDYFMTKNYKGETVKIASLADAARATGIEINETPDIINKAVNNFIETPYGKISCMEDVVKLFRKS